MKLDRDQCARDQAGEEYEDRLKDNAMQQKDGTADQDRIGRERGRQAGIHYGNHCSGVGRGNLGAKCRPSH